ncbi:MAG: metallophosphoesterase [Gemmatimonadota bacterium]|nr:MAG: metallophosphoesterase [Gemmatimonadota bacterium]
MKMRSVITRTAYCVVTVLILGAGLRCARTGFVVEKYPEDFYVVPKLLPDIRNNDKVTFLVYSDNQAGWRVKEKFLNRSNWTSWKMVMVPFYQLYLFGNGLWGFANWLRHVPDYGKKERIMVRDAIYAEAQKTGVDFILNIGDLVTHDGRRPSHWATFLKENKAEHPLLKEIPYLPVLGNHERGNDTTYGFSNFEAVFGYPRFYVVECTHGVLIVVDSNLILDQYQYIDDDVQEELFEKWFVSGEDAKERSWLEKQLSLYDKSFKIVAMHNPPISFGKHHADWLEQSNGRNLLEKRQQLLKLIGEHGVQVVFSGHDHLYQHSVLQCGDQQRVHLIVGGGGGATLRGGYDPEVQMKYQQHFVNEGLDVSLLNQAMIYHYYCVQVNASELVIKVIEVTMKEEQPTSLVEEIRIEKTVKD